MCHVSDEDDDHGDDDDHQHHIPHILQEASLFYQLPANVQCIMDCGGIAAVADPEGPKKIFGRPAPPLISGSG